MRRSNENMVTNGNGRKLDRLEVAYMLREDMARVPNTNKAMAMFARTRIRPLLSYSKKTVDVDIFCSLWKVLKVIIPVKPPSHELGHGRQQEV